MGGAIALDFDPTHHQRLHGHEIAKADISTALVDEFDLARLFDRHPTVTPMSLYHILAHKLDIYCTTLLLPSQQNSPTQQATRQRINTLHSFLQTKGLIMEFPGFDEVSLNPGTSEVSMTAQESSSGCFTPSVGKVDSKGKEKSEFHRVDDARCVIIFLTADYLLALSKGGTHSRPQQPTHHEILTVTSEESMHTAIGSDNGTHVSHSPEHHADGHALSHHHPLSSTTHSSTSPNAIHPSPSDIINVATANMTPEDLAAMERTWKEFLYIQKSLPSTKIIPVVVEHAALHTIDWPVPLQRLYYPHLFHHSTISPASSPAPQPTADYFHHHPLIHIVHCQPAHDPSHSSCAASSSPVSPSHGSSGGFLSRRSFTGQSTFSAHLSNNSSAHGSSHGHQNSQHGNHPSHSMHVDKLFDTILHVIRIPLKPLIQEELDRVLSRSVSLSTSAKFNTGHHHSEGNGDHSVISTSSRNSSRPQSSSLPHPRRSFNIPSLSPGSSSSALHGLPINQQQQQLQQQLQQQQPDVSLLSSASAPLLDDSLAAQQVPLVSSVIHFFVVEGRIAPAKAREYASIMTQQDHLESIPALKHHLQHRNADYLQTKLGMTELEAKRMLQLLLKATTDAQEVRRRRSVGGGEISTAMLDHIQQQQLQLQQQQLLAENSSLVAEEHSLRPGHNIITTERHGSSNNLFTSTLNNNNYNSDSAKGSVVSSGGGSSKKQQQHSPKVNRRRRSDGSSFFTFGTPSVGPGSQKERSSSPGGAVSVGYEASGVATHSNEQQSQRHRSNSSGSLSGNNNNNNNNSMMQMVMNTVSSIIMPAHHHQHQHHPSSSSHESQYEHHSGRSLGGGSSVASSPKNASSVSHSQSQTQKAAQKATQKETQTHPAAAESPAHQADEAK